ncbi:MAG: hypothetical protein CMJ48_04165 [Planctomycetaceae bacterium]|nr:hypothetical protein [Planctomycetaceae bacterium]
MDFPTCPSCSQSVIDDDPKVCPFCGASMAGQAPEAEKKAAPKAPPKLDQPAAKPRRKPPEASTETPFDLNPTLDQSSVRLARKPAKGRSYRIVCPMCDTPGFTTPAAVGREVRCANPDCLVPVFTAPKPEAPKEEPDDGAEVKRGLSAGAITMIVVVLLLAGGGGAFYYIFDPANEDQPLVDEPYVPDADAPTDPDDDPSKPDVAVTPTAPTDTGPTLAKIVSLAPDEMVTSAQNAPRGEKPDSRVATARAFAQLGQIEQALGEIDQLGHVSSGNRSRTVVPLAEIASFQIRIGDSTAALATLQKALIAAAELPDRGLESVYASAKLAVPLVAAGRLSEAGQLVAAHADATPLGQLAAAVQRVEAYGSWDFDRDMRQQAAYPPANPTWSSVAESLVLRGLISEALKWARAAPDAPTKSDALAAWAVALVRSEMSHSKPWPAVSETIAPEIQGLTPPAKARVLARVCRVLQDAKQTDAAQQVLAQAATALDPASIPEPYEIPETAQVYELKLPDPTAGRASALAAAEIAMAQAAGGESDVSLMTLEMARAFLHTTAPRVNDARRLLAATDNRGSVERMLTEALNLKNADEARRAFNKYRRQCRTLFDAARESQSIEAAIVRRVMELHPKGTEGTAETVGWRELAASDPWDKLRQFTQKQIDAGKPEQAATAIQSFKTGAEGASDWKRHWSLVLISRLANRGKLDEALQFTAAIKYGPWRRAGERTLSAWSVDNDQFVAIWEYAHSERQAHSDKVALLAGLVAGSVKSSAPSAEKTVKQTAAAAEK